ncbi:hypothetical protein [Sphingorhabdus sp.]|uniref:hypothetical protein n=1 Tax=Sphingorhabdus sp. TaxID=1902408 RepID=UPI0039834C2A
MNNPNRISLTIVGGASLASLGTYYIMTKYASGDAAAPTMQQEGVTETKGYVTSTRSVNWQVLLKRAVEKKTSLLTLTKKYDIQSDRELTQSIFKIEASNTRVRVNYHVEYPIGYIMTPGSFKVSGGADGLVLTMKRPELIAKPSVRLDKAMVIDSGLLFDEQKALVRLQQSIQRVAEKRAKAVLRGKDVLPTSERALRAFLQPFLIAAADGKPVPPIKIIYR